MRRSTALAAALVALALPRIAQAQTPSVTPTPAPIALTFQFDCASVPWSCGDGPSDVRWQLYEVVGCRQSGQEGCRYERIGSVLPGQTVMLWVGHRYKLFLAANQDRSDRVSRSCPVTSNSGGSWLGIHSNCAINDEACAGPQNWQIYFRTDTRLIHVFKHIGDCSTHLLYRTSLGWIITWGLPGELATPPVIATMTAPLVTATGSPSATMTVAPTATAAGTPTITTAEPGLPTSTGTASATVVSEPTAMPTRVALLLPILAGSVR